MACNCGKRETKKETRRTELREDKKAPRGKDNNYDRKDN